MSLAAYARENNKSENRVKKIFASQFHTFYSIKTLKLNSLTLFYQHTEFQFHFQCPSVAACAFLVGERICVTSQRNVRLCVTVICLTHFLFLKLFLKDSPSSTFYIPSPCFIPVHSLYFWKNLCDRTWQVNRVSF